MLWQRKVTDQTTHEAASPVVSGGRVFVSGNLRGKDPKDPPGAMFVFG